MTRKSRISAKKWKEIGKLIRGWAGSDSGRDDICAVLSDADLDAFDDEFAERVKRAFGDD